jgi:hypothetical protein
LIQDREILTGKIDGKEMDCAKFARDLRKDIWALSFGMSLDEVDDPLSKSMWDKITVRMTKNVEIYREVFGCYPDDTMKTTEDIVTIKEKARPDLYDEKKDQIVGYAVTFPQQFLSEENMIKGPYVEIKSLIVPHFIST